MENRSAPPPYTAFNNSDHSNLSAEPSAPHQGYYNNHDQNSGHMYPDLDHYKGTQRENSSHHPSAQQIGHIPVTSPPQPTPVIMNPTVTVVNTAVPGGCPVCHNTNWTGTYPCLAWLCCIFCFPCGIICCCCMRKKKCTKCGFVVG